MSQLTHNSSEQNPDKLESILHMDTSFQNLDLELNELILSEEDICLDRDVPQGDSEKHRVEISKALPLVTQSIPFTANQGKRPFAIANIMAQANTLENLYQITVTELRKQFEVDRAVIYQFQSPTYGTVIAESVAAAYRPALGQTMAALAFGSVNIKSYEQQPVVSISDAAETAINPYQMQLYQHLQVQAALTIPVFLKDELWGLLVLQSCSTPRQWTKREISCFYQVSTELTLKLQIHELNKQHQKEVEGERLLRRIIEEIGDSADTQQIFEFTARTLHQYLHTDRVVILQLNSDENNYSKSVVAESVSANFISTQDISQNEYYISEQMNHAFEQGDVWKSADIYEQGLSERHLDMLARLQVHAMLVVPLFKAGQLWGVCYVHHCVAPRNWKATEIAFVQRVVAQLNMALQQADYIEQVKKKTQQLKQIAHQEQLITKITERLRKTTDLSKTLRTAVRDIRHMLNADRVGLFQFDVATNYSVGEFVVEDVAKDVASAMATKVQDHCFAEGQAENYSKGRYWVVNDVETLDLPDCLVELLSQLQVRASLVVPLLKGDILWGLFCVHQCNGPRQWQDAEVEFVHRIGAQLNLALKQADYIEQVKKKNRQLKQIAHQEQLITKITERLRKTTDLSKTLRTTVRDIRHMLNADRVGLFQFDVATNYSVGEFVVEDVAKDVVSAMATKVQDHCFAEGQAENYSKGRYWVVNDVETLDLPDCLVELLSQLQVRASLVVPLLKGDILWGLFCVHQCNGPRQWQDAEVEFVHRIGAQLNLALKQAEYLDQLKEKNTALKETAAREKASKEDLQEQVLQLLLEVRPALQGDLTVRAPVTETEVGTVASAYNNTLQSLQEIVVEVKQAAEQVGQTSQLSTKFVSSLNAEAQQQAHSLENTLKHVQEIMSFTETVVGDAKRVEAAVQQANETVQIGDTAMNHTVDGIIAIRSTVADTNQRIKQLSESSQKVSRIVSLIGNFTTQTQLLAMNASIEATRAGKYGRGFAVVADEVRFLARQSAEAATEIEQLVQEIQVNTAEVSAAMETGIQQVATGTTLVKDARQNLTAIVEATGQISGLIQGITHTTHKQASEFKDIAVTVTQATEIANQTSHKSERLTQSLHQLLSTAKTLQAGTDKFKVD